MTFSVMIRGLLSVALLCTLVMGDPLSMYTLSSAKVETRPNDYFDPWSVEIFSTKKNTLYTYNVPTKKELPPTLMIKVISHMNEGGPIEYEISLCDGFEISALRSFFEKFGKPADTFPTSCPFGPGNWTLLKAESPTDLIPPNIPDGPFSIVIQIYEEGEEPYVQAEVKGKLFHSTPLAVR